MIEEKRIQNTKFTEFEIPKLTIRNRLNLQHGHIVTCRQKASEIKLILGLIKKRAKRKYKIY